MGIGSGNDKKRAGRRLVVGVKGKGVPRQFPALPEDEVRLVPHRFKAIDPTGPRALRQNKDRVVGADTDTASPRLDTTGKERTVS